MADKLVESKIRCDKVTLFTERGCRYCRNAEEMLKQYNFVPGALEVVDITQRKDVQDYLQQRTGHRTLPVVFIGRCCIGGLSDLQNMDCKLPRILQQIGALQ
ncbi:glutaredoxin-1-like [Pezoporus wallicus]|uniref:glutaredoxin-1-like n=1 Tax=Pezoporus wallicus TaxID=35540 RepID=UPI00254B2F0F|nr:glutaredoxin-1-like isoform X2 [Pezoporus wallicus]XP_057254420.1 glutaredoxin-1-like [Pezoporus wallicus]XP_061301294.1 glutaredoxin-1-like isoform X2 [Pezoporus flaviventris]XP_061301296.1 glutaredoxin-1-like isoform X2 [Pezoporus flaviventris]